MGSNNKTFYACLQCVEDRYVLHERISLREESPADDDVGRGRHNNKQSASCPVRWCSILGGLLGTSFISELYNYTAMSTYTGFHVVESEM